MTALERDWSSTYRRKVYGNFAQVVNECGVRRVHQMDGSQMARGREMPRKTIKEIIKKNLEISELDKCMT